MENNCPCCGRHCPREDLHCPRGGEYFGMKTGVPGGAGDIPQEKAILLLRKCGHFLHHSAGQGGAAPLLDALTGEEKKTLETLLEKCLKSWQGE
ncbi:MAG: hypothetical protein ACI4LH_08720 [Candidatus Heritagella sp.]